MGLPSSSKRSQGLRRSFSPLRTASGDALVRTRLDRIRKVHTLAIDHGQEVDAESLVVG